MLRSDTAQLAGLFIESIFYGIYLVTFGYCLHALFRCPSGWKRPGEMSFGPLFVALSLFCIGTINLTFAFYRILDLQEHGCEATPSSNACLGKTWVNILKASTMNAQVLIADSALIYRCWQVYAKEWKFVLFPIALWVGALVVTICMIWADYKLFHSDEMIRLIRIVSLECTVFWVITIVLNIYATGMIVFRICQADKMMRSLGRSETTLSESSTGQWPTKLQKVIRIVIDSGLMYTATSFAVFCSQLVADSSAYITTSADMIVIGIAFNLINIRVAKARNTTPNNADPNILTIMEFNRDCSLVAHASQQTSSHPSRANSVYETHYVESSVKPPADNVV